MRTKTINVYKFSELSDKAKQRAIENYRGTETFDHMFQEAWETLNAFCDLFGVRIREYDWLEHYRSSWSFDSIDSDVLRLSSLRLQKWLWNNYKSSLYKGKYYSKSLGYDKNGKYNYRFRHSKCQLDNTGVLTGMCYDDIVLNPVYEFLNDKNPSKEIDLEDLLNDCLQELAICVRKEYYYRLEDEQIIEDIEANEWEFTKDGKMY